MSSSRPVLIETDNLSEGWAKVFLTSLFGGGGECVTLALRDFSENIPAEDVGIRDALASHLALANKARQLEGESMIPNIDQTALTIVPFGRWIRAGKPSVKELSDWYLSNLLPRLKARCSKNSHGTYFERMVAYTGVKSNGAKHVPREVNQIDFIIQSWKDRALKGRRPRQSALQIACFDPAKDHTGSALAGFPCLQQVSLTYKEAGTLELNAFYPTQYTFDRGYGNYLGLCQLGQIIAHELGLRFSAFTCFIARPEVGWGSKQFHEPLANKLAARLKSLCS